MSEEFIPITSRISCEQIIHCCQVNAAKNNIAEIFYLCGFASDITGSKIAYLRKWALKNHYGLTCFDYRGHGSSSGAVRDFIFFRLVRRFCQILNILLKKNKLSLALPWVLG